MNNEFDVAVVGYGPTGMAASALLGQLGHKVVVLERWSALYGLPRFTHIDDETARTLQGICDIDLALKKSTPTEYHWVNGRDELLLHIPTFQGSMGYPVHLSINQPDIEAAIDSRLRELPNVEIRQGWGVSGIDQDGEGVRLEVAPWLGDRADLAQTSTITANFVIAADGSRSTIRTLLGGEHTDYGFHEQWINIDMEWLRPRDERFSGSRQFCDPVRGHMFMGIGTNLQRFEFAVLEGEDATELQKPEAAWAWLRETHGLGPEDLKIVRHLSYTFGGRLAKQWRHDRVFLAGDAAHLMPPYLGQGACSGIRDSANLAWKLNLVLTGVAEDGLLDTYQEERAPHADALIQMNIGLGRVANMADPVAAEARDAAFKAGQVPPTPALPKLSGRALPQDPAQPAVGTLAPQGTLRSEGLEHRGDDLLGAGFQLVATAAALSALDAAHRRIIDDMDIRLLRLGGEVADVDGTYAAFLRDNDADAALVRPDRIVFGTSRAEGLPALLDAVVASLTPVHTERQSSPA